MRELVAGGRWSPLFDAAQSASHVTVIMMNMKMEIRTQYGLSGRAASGIDEGAGAVTAASGHS
jgi:hypothetical protein